MLVSIVTAPHAVSCLCLARLGISSSAYLTQFDGLPYYCDFSLLIYRLTTRRCLVPIM